MRTLLDINDKLNEIRLELRNTGGNRKIWVIVEGVSDVRLYRKLLDGPYVQIEEVPGGCENITSLVDQISTLTDRVIGIRDADFIHLTGSSFDEKRIFLTDGHDAEVMMLISDETMRALCSEYHPSVFQKYQEFRERLFQSVKFYGGVRYFESVNRFELKFKGLGLSPFFDASNLELNRKKCVDIINKRSDSKTREFTVEEVEALIADKTDLYNVCCGHDVTAAFALFVSGFHTNEAGKKKGVSHEHIESFLRGAYGKREFQKTVLYEQLIEWQDRTSWSLFT